MFIISIEIFDKRQPNTAEQPIWHVFFLSARLIFLNEGVLRVKQKLAVPAPPPFLFNLWFLLKNWFH